MISDTYGQTMRGRRSNSGLSAKQGLGATRGQDKESTGELDLASLFRDARFVPEFWDALRILNHPLSK